jgi:hypothetical protein
MSKHPKHVLGSNVLTVVVFSALFVISSGCSETSFNAQSSVEKERSSSNSNPASDDLNGVLDSLIDSWDDGVPEGLEDSNANGVPDVLEDLNGDGFADGKIDVDGDGVVDTFPDDIKAIIGGSSSSSKIDGSSSVKDCALAELKSLLKKGTKTIRYEGNKDKSSEQCHTDIRNSPSAKIWGYKTWKERVDFGGSNVVCKMNLRSTGEVEYDDSLVFSINDKVLMWTSIGIDALSKDKDGIYMYNWDKLMGTSNGGAAACIDGSTKCEVPPTEEKGKLGLAFNDEVNLKLMKEIESSGAEFILRAYGDDDPFKDCKHTGVEIVIEYEYFEK